MLSHDKNYRDKTDVLYNLQLNRGGKREREKKRMFTEEKKEVKRINPKSAFAEGTRISGKQETSHTREKERRVI